MKWRRLFALLPLAYIIWWLYTLFTVIVQWLNVPISQLFSVSLLQIIMIILFFTVGIIGLIIAFIAIFLLLVNYYEV